MTRLPLPKKGDLFFLPLGGAGDIGMNFNLYGCDNQWIIVDCGVSFKDSDTPGVDVFMPDISVLKSHEKNIKGLLVTHAHEDHIGGVHYLWPYLKCPVYATPFSAYLLKQRLVESRIDDKVDLRIVNLESKFSIGNFKLELINMSHSILEPNAVLLKINKMNILHTGDWKIDDTPNIGSKVNKKRLLSISKEGINAIICDSTNAMVDGVSGSEKSLEKGLGESIKDCKGVIFATTFASNLERVLTLTKLARKINRKVGLVGRSMWRMTDAAKALGYIDKNINFLKEKELKNVKREELFVICTGSQGEHLGGLNRIINDMHPHISFKKKDRIIFSSRIIPGNEKEIGNLINKLVHNNVEVVLPNKNNIHVSGHPAKDELKQMYDWIKPKISIPVHGEAIHIHEHAKLARGMGVKKVIEPKNGDLIKISSSDAKIIENFPAGKIAKDGLSLLPKSSEIFKLRKKMMYNGVVSINIIVDDTGNLYSFPKVDYLGVVDSELKKLEDKFSLYIHERLSSYIPISKKNKNEVLEAIRKVSKKYNKSLFGKDPLAIINIITL